MRTTPHNIETLTAATRLLFGGTPPAALEELTLDQLREAYRRCVKRTHPDKARGKGSEEFQEVITAYRLLCAFVKDRSAHREGVEDMAWVRRMNHGESNQAADHGPPPARAISPSALGGRFYYRGNVPPIQLRLGRYLYFRGVISWNMLVEALRWQKDTRPSLGELAVREKYLTPRDLQGILSRSRNGVPFGRAARETGKLTDRQIRSLLTIQENYGGRVGDFFVRGGILSREQVESLARELGEHNGRFRHVLPLVTTW